MKNWPKSRMTKFFLSYTVAKLGGIRKQRGKPMIIKVMSREKLSEYSRGQHDETAIMIALSGDDWATWNNAKYRTNISCYKMVMAAFHAAIDECELNSKVTKNRLLLEI